MLLSRNVGRNLAQNHEVDRAQSGTLACIVGAPHGNLTSFTTVPTKYSSFHKTSFYKLILFNHVALLSTFLLQPYYFLNLCSALCQEDLGQFKICISVLAAGFTLREGRNSLLALPAYVSCELHIKHLSADHSHCCGHHVHCSLPVSVSLLGHWNHYLAFSALLHML